MYTTFINNEQYLEDECIEYPNLSMLVETAGVTRPGEVDASEQNKQFEFTT
jgi:short-subunit dehydrogenase involved in D-alanine esterification of teichoic acids